MTAPSALPVPHLAVDGVEGPLDWLLEQARAQRLDLARISIAALVAAFEAALLEALAGPLLPAAALARWADWLVMAADLTALRSRLLLATGSADRQQAEAEAEILRRRLLGRAEATAAAAWLDGRNQLGRDTFARGAADRGPKPGVAALGRVSGPGLGDVTALLRACLVCLALPPGTAAAFAAPALPPWTVADALDRIRRRLPPAGPAPFAAFLPAIPAATRRRPLHCRAAVATTLLGLLELARDGTLTLTEEAAGISVAVAPALSPSP